MRDQKSYPKVGSLPKDLFCSAFPWVLLPQCDFARLTSLLVTTLLLFALVNGTLKPNLPNFNYK